MQKYAELQPIKGEEVYADYDEQTAMYCVFGIESGFAYSSHASEEDANLAAKSRQKQKASFDFNQGESHPMLEVEDHERIPICQFNK